jgi:multidrug resistance efflux pump
MAVVEIQTPRLKIEYDPTPKWVPAPPEPVSVPAPAPEPRAAVRRFWRIIPFVITLGAVALAVPFGWAMWKSYVEAPWTRDSTVRAYVVSMAPEISGRIVQLPVVDNQFVHKGDLLLVIDKTDFKISMQQAEAEVAQAQVNAENARRQAERRRKLTTLEVAMEQRQNFETNATSTQAQYESALARRDQARVNLERTEIRSPVNGWVTNLLAQEGDYVSIGKDVISLVNADSFWLDAYFEETQLAPIREGDPATIKLMGFSQIVRGEVGSVSRGITVSNAKADQQGLATVNPIFTWVRLAQRVPVRIRIDEVPNGVRLVAGLTATVQIEPRGRHLAN